MNNADTPEKSACVHRVDDNDGVITYPDNIENVGECSEGCCSYYRCKTCGYRFKVEFN